MTRIRIGIMGFGRIGRQLYRLAARDDRYDIVAISDIARPDILHHLLCSEARNPALYRLEGNYLSGGHSRTRMLRADQPSEVPWDVFGTDLVIDATGLYRSRAALQPHLDNGAGRILVSTLPEGGIDRLIIRGVNDADAAAGDRIVSAGSPTTSAMALIMKVVCDQLDIEHVTMTSVHAYTSDQTLQDHAGPDYRRSRSGAENIIPNASQTPAFVEQVLPALAGKVSGYAMNVPVQVGSLLDLTIVCTDPAVRGGTINALMIAAAEQRPDLIETTSDPIVSSDVIGCDKTALMDLSATLKAGSRTIKLLAWYESLGHARRLLEVATLYDGLGGRG